MNKLIKQGLIVEDHWTLVKDASTASVTDLPAGDLILPLSLWKQFSGALPGRKTGVWLNSDEHTSALKDACHDLPLIAINFPVFTDGRGYSYAHVLRTQYGYKGELRAIGDVLIDQLFFMKRCGFDSYALREDLKPEVGVRHLQDFNVTYQAATDNPSPLFRRR